MLISDANPVSRPISFLLIHFRSRDTPRLFKQGIFWHLFILKNGEFGGAVISQDAKEVCNGAVKSKTAHGELLLNRRDYLLTLRPDLHDTLCDPPRNRSFGDLVRGGDTHTVGRHRQTVRNHNRRGPRAIYLPAQHRRRAQLLWTQNAHLPCR